MYVSSQYLLLKSELSTSTAQNNPFYVILSWVLDFEELEIENKESLKVSDDEKIRPVPSQRGPIPNQLAGQGRARQDARRDGASLPHPERAPWRKKNNKNN